MRLPPVSVLCLHGYSQDGNVLRTQLKRLTQRLELRAHFHFQDAPFAVPSMADPSSQGFAWWKPRRDAVSDWHYDGVEESLQLLSEANAAEKKRSGSGFAGVLGFSQGGALASLLVGLRERSEPTMMPLPELRFAMFAGAFRYRAATPSYDYLFEGRPLMMPSLHCIGERDTIIKGATSEVLEACFATERRTSCRHGGGHVVPSGTPSLDVFDAFVEAQQKAALAALATEWSNGSYC